MSNASLSQEDENHISGYRQLISPEIAAINEVKHIEEEIIDARS